MNRAVMLLALLWGCGEATQTDAVLQIEPIPMAVAVTAKPPGQIWVVPDRAVSSPLARTASPRHKEVISKLTEVVEAQLLDPNNPWGVAHALVGLGPDIKSASGVPLVPLLFEQFGEVVEAEGEKMVTFPRKVGDIRVEPHTDLLLKALSEASVSPMMSVTVDGQKMVVGDLMRNSMWRLPSEFSDYNDTAWTLAGLAAWSPSGLEWTNAKGKQWTLNNFTHLVVEALYTDTAFLREATKTGAPLSKRGQGIFKYTCGGAHLAQGAALAVAKGFGEEGDREKVAETLQGWLQRQDFELRQIDQGLRDHPKYGMVLMVQRLKFLGHLVETLHKMAALNLVQETPELRAATDSAEEELLQTVTLFEQNGIYKNLEIIRAGDEQLYLDICGDSAHALNGLKLATGAKIAY